MPVLSLLFFCWSRWLAGVHGRRWLLQRLLMLVGPMGEHGAATHWGDATPVAAAADAGSLLKFDQRANMEPHFAATPHPRCHGR